ncbi:MAG: T9SS type A sorting domain-containing protein [Bacteroidota bacterium]
MKFWARWIVHICAITITFFAGQYLINQSPDQPKKEYPLQHFKRSYSQDGGPEARVAFDRMRYADPKTGLIPQGIRKLELEFAQKLNAKSKNVNARLADTWDRRGPYNIGGRTRALAIDVTDENILLAGGVSGGLWRSIDQGSTWTRVTEVDEHPGITAIAQDTRSGFENIWYYSTGERIGNSASGGEAFYQGNGIYKSTNGGVSWSLLTVTENTTPEIISAGEPFDLTYGIQVHPTTGDVYVATFVGIYRSTNGGASFEEVLGAGFDRITDIHITNTGVLYAAINSGSGNEGIFRSTDGGSGTWVDITDASFPATFSRTVISSAPSNPKVLYVLSDGTSSSPVGHDFWKYTYVSGDGSGAGGTWVDRSTNLPNYGAPVGDFDSQSGYDLIVKVKPDDENVVFIGGTDLYRSNDGFATTPNTDPTVVNNTRWIGGYSTVNNVSRYTNQHPDQHALVFLPSDPDVMISGHDGGLSITMDNTSNGAGHEPVSWTFLNNGYYTTQFYAVAIDPTASDPSDTYYDFVMGGMQDNGTWGLNSPTETDAWTELLSGDGGFCFMADGGVRSYRSVQNGTTFRFANPLLQSGFQRIDPDGATGLLFINPYVLDPNDNDIMYYAGGTFVYRHDNISTVTLPNGNDPLTDWVSLTSTTISGTGNTISAIEVSTSSANTLYYGTSLGEVYKVANANSGSMPTRTDITDPSFPSAYVSCIAIDPANADNVMVIFSNYGVQSIFYSTDGGSNWTNVSGTLEENTDGTGSGPSVHWAAITNNAQLPGFFVGTSTGLYSTSTLNGTSTVWEQEGPNNLGNVVVDMVRIREGDGLVVVGTHANGVYSFRPSASGTPEVSFQTSSSTVTENEAVAASGGLCSGYQDYTVTMEINAAPTGDATITLTPAVSSSAVEDSDFNFTTNGNFTSPSTTLTFSDGSTANQTFTVRIYDDAAEEPSEDLTFEYSISGTTDAVAGSGNQTFTFTINDNDIAPAGTTLTTVYSEDFTSPGIFDIVLFGGHTISGNSNSWFIGSGLSIDGNSAYAAESGLTTYQKDVTTQMGLRSPVIDATGVSGMTLEFDFIADGESGSDFGSLWYQLDGSSLTTIIEGSTTSPYVGVSTATSRTVSLPAALDGQMFRLVWFWFNDNNSAGNDPAFVIDNISITTGAAGNTISSILNSSTEEYLGPNATVSFYDETTGDIMATIENTSSHDYGCTTVTIDRAGTGTEESWNGGGGSSVASKTYLITPTNNNVSGTYNITLYYTDAEISGWEAGTSNSRASLNIAKTSGSFTNIDGGNPGTDDYLGTSAAVGTFGSDVTVTASFASGFSGFAVGDPGPPPPLPLELITFTGQNIGTDIHLYWASATEVNTDRIEIERSTDAESFEKIGTVKAQGNSTRLHEYSFIDESLSFGTYYYRLKMIDLDRTYEYSNTIRVIQDNSLFSIRSIFPNPAIYEAQVSFELEKEEAITLTIVDPQGKLVKSIYVLADKGLNTEKLDISSLSSGVYLVVISNGLRRSTSRLLVQ